MSSIVYVGVGQCGNQILESFIENELNSKRLNYNYLQSQNEKLRCVFVDSETKVINKIRTQSQFKNLIREENCISGVNGRGSNWCYGYNGCKSSPNISQCVIEQIRKEVERCDNYLGTVMCHSLGGGTGSGFGSKLTELIRDELQTQHIFNCVVAPSDIGGDSPLQYYNCLLSLASLNRSSDGIMLFHNDSVLNQLGLDLVSPVKLADKNYKSQTESYPMNSRQLSNYPVHQISIKSINNLISTQMGSLLAPCSSLYPWTTNKNFLNIELNEILRSLCQFSDSKLIRCVSSNTNLDSNKDWNDIAKSCVRNLKCGYGNVYDTISSICCYRGVGKGNKHMPSILTMQDQLNKKLNFVKWNKSEAIDIWMDVNSYDNKQITLAFNSACIVNYLKYIKLKSMEKFQASAYLHWYYKFGGCKELFSESFEEFEKIISNYLQLIN